MIQYHLIFLKLIAFSYLMYKPICASDLKGAIIPANNHNNSPILYTDKENSLNAIIQQAKNLGKNNESLLEKNELLIGIFQKWKALEKHKDYNDVDKEKAEKAIDICILQVFPENIKSFEDFYSQQPNVIAKIDAEEKLENFYEIIQCMRKIKLMQYNLASGQETKDGINNIFFQETYNFFEKSNCFDRYWKILISNEHINKISFDRGKILEEKHQALLKEKAIMEKTLLEEHKEISK